MFNINLKLLAFCIVTVALPCGILICLEKAHASELEVTARDIQRFNACANRAIYSGFEKEKDVIREAIKCGAYGKAVAHIESANGTSKWSKERLNAYGIMVWDKKGKRHIRTFKTTGEADAKWAAIWFGGYNKIAGNYRKFATSWTGEAHAVPHYSAFLKKWVPTYTRLYSQFK